MLGHVEIHEMKTQGITLRVSEDDEEVAYVTLPGHPGIGAKGIVARQVRLSDLLPYKGADVYLDLDADGRLIGLEILG
jgi:hypothetical protein